jgi:hypothetical protein
MPEDPAVAEFDLAGKPTVELDSGCPIVKAAYNIFDKILVNI